jgi:hypothetical protein
MFLIREDETGISLTYDFTWAGISGFGITRTAYYYHGAVEYPQAAEE